jgi:hypothetical protein
MVVTWKRPDCGRRLKVHEHARKSLGEDRDDARDEAQEKLNEKISMHERICPRR